jgi:hypothetical protein
MAKFTVGTRVVTVEGRTGSVTSLGSLKTGGRGRPKVIVRVLLDNGIDAEFTLTELTAVSVAA